MGHFLKKAAPIGAADKFFVSNALLVLVKPLSHDVKPFISTLFGGLKVFSLCFVHVAYLLGDPLMLILFCAT